MAHHRVLALLGGTAAAVTAALIMPAGNAEATTAAGGPYETCDGAVCLVMGPDNPADWTYGGLRPMFTQWQGTQPYLVDVTNPDGSVTDAGSYAVNVSDTWTPMAYSDVYTYGDFTPTVGAESVNLGAFGDLSGTTVYDTVIGNFHNLTIDLPNGVSYWVLSTPTFTNTVVTIASEGGSQDYLQVGNAEPTLLWDALWNPSIVPVADYLEPADPYAGIDFDPSSFLDGGIPAG